MKQVRQQTNNNIYAAQIAALMLFGFDKNEAIEGIKLSMKHNDDHKNNDDNKDDVDNMDMDSAMTYLLKKGFPSKQCFNAIIAAKYDVILAEEYLYINKGIPDTSQSNAQCVSLLNMGFSNDESIAALQISSGDINLAIDIIQSSVRQNECSYSVQDCDHVLKLIEILKEYNKKGTIILDNDNMFITNLINVFNHILFNHNNDKDFEWIYSNFCNCDIRKCAMMKRNGRIRGIDIDQKINNDIDNYNNRKMNSYYDMYDKIHCYFMHTYDRGRRLTDNCNDQNISKISTINHRFNKFSTSKRIMKNYSFSLSFYYWDYFKNSNEDDGNLPNSGFKQKDWYINPKYYSLKDELLNNEIQRISMAEFDNEYEKANKKSESIYCKTLLADPEIKPSVSQGKKERVLILQGRYETSFYGITQGTPIQIDHLISIIVYCGYTRLSFEFSKTFRRDLSKPDDYHEIKERHSNFHHLAKHLTEAINVYSRPAFLGNFSVFYHGISEEMLFNRLVCRTYQPLSTTYSYEVARTFSNNNGIVLKLSCSPNTKYFDCCWLSDFPSEGELLFTKTWRLTIQNITMIKYSKYSIDFEQYIQALTILDSLFSGVPAASRLAKDVNVLNIFYKTAAIAQNFFYKTPQHISHNPIDYNGTPIRPVLKLLVTKLVKHELNRSVPTTYNKITNIHRYIEGLLHEICIKKQVVVVDVKLLNTEMVDQFYSTGYQGFLFLKYLIFNVANQMVKVDILSLLFPNVVCIEQRQTQPITSTQMDYFVSCIKNVNPKCESVIIWIMNSINNKHNVYNLVSHYRKKFGHLKWFLYCVPSPDGIIVGAKRNKRT